MNDEVVSHRNC